MVLTDCENPSVDVPGLTISLRRDEMVDLMGDLFTAPWRGVLRESLLRILEPDDTGFRGLTCTSLVTADCDPARMSAALRELPSQPLPSTKMPEGMLDGLERIQELVEEQLPASVSALSA